MDTENIAASRDFGRPADVVYGDFSDAVHREIQPGVGSVWEIQVAGGERRYRTKLLTLRGTNAVDEIWILRVDPTSGDYENVLHLKGTAAEEFVALIRNKAFEPIESVPSYRAPVQTLPDTGTLQAAYEHDSEAFRALIESDTNAVDVVAVANRQKVVAEFRRLLHDELHFESRKLAHPAKSQEGVWQQFFEENPWLLGLGLSSQLYVGWDPERLEQVVAGHDVTGPGKRVDALMRTAGAAQLMVFAEIKHHRTSLLGTEYRSGCFSPSSELSGAVAQSHGTVQIAQEKMGTVLRAKYSDEAPWDGLDTHLFRPRSFVIAGRTSELLREDGSVDIGRLRSFELFRRNMQEPEILTFDEILARAEAVVSSHRVETSAPTA